VLEPADESTLHEKTRLRAAMKAVRGGLSAEQRLRDSEQIIARLLQLPELTTAETIFVYVSCRNEVQTHELIRQCWQRGKIIAVPKVGDGGQMEAHRIEAWDQLALGPFGILAPLGTAAFAGTLDICLTPGLAFTRRGDRLGYGQGHYDRFLVAQPDIIPVGLAFDCQLIERIPTDPHDRPMRLIVTPSREVRTQ